MPHYLKTSTYTHASQVVWKGNLVRVQGGGVRTSQVAVNANVIEKQLESYIARLTQHVYTVHGHHTKIGERLIVLAYEGRGGLSERP